MADPLRKSRTTDTELETVLATCRARLESFARRLCRGDVDPDDLVQETMERVWRYRGSWDPTGNSEAWVLRTAFHAFLDLRRRAERGPRALPDCEPPPPEPACPTEIRDEIEHALRDLKPIERDLLLEFHRDGRTLQELADRHGLSINTVKSHLHRARRKLPGGDES